MEKKLDQVLKNIEQTKQEQKNYHIRDIYLKYSDMLDKIRIGSSLTNDQYVSLINTEYNVLCWLVEAFMNDNVGNNKEEVISAIITLLGMLSNTMCYFDRKYYFDNKYSIKDGVYFHNSHSVWEGIFKDLKSKKFMEKIEDFMFFDCNFNQHDVDVFKAMIKNNVDQAKSNIKDNQKILKRLDTIQEYQKLNEAINGLVAKDVEKIVDKIPENQQDSIQKHVDQTLVKLAYV